MYKYRKLLLACSLLPMLAACNSAPEYHELTPVVEPAILFADQKLDSIRFFTYDNWSATPQQDWLGIEGPSRQDNVQYDYRRSILYRVLVSAQPNTTGKTRIGTVLVHSYEYDSLFPIMQLGILNVSHPQYKADSWIDDSQFYPEVAHFELTDSRPKQRLSQEFAQWEQQAAEIVAALTAPAPAQVVSTVSPGDPGAWTCACGTVNDGKFCISCG